jgi:hypothetical protein
LWKKHRCEIKHKLTPTQETTSLGQLSAYGEEVAIQAITTAVASGWQGLRPGDIVHGKNGNGFRASPTVIDLDAYREKIIQNSIRQSKIEMEDFTADVPIELRNLGNCSEAVYARQRIAARKAAMEAINK